VRLRKRGAADPKKPGSTVTHSTNPVVRALKKFPWGKLRPRVPSLKKALGPLLLLTVIGLLVSYLFILTSLKPKTEGKRIVMSEVFTSAREKRVKHANFLDLDSTIILDIYDYSPIPPSLPKPIPVLDARGRQVRGPNGKPLTIQPPAPPFTPPDVHRFWTPYPRSDSETTVIVDELVVAGASFDFDPQVPKARLKFIAQFLYPLLILAALFSFFFMLITGQGGGAADFLGFSKFAAKVQRKRKRAGAITFDDVAAIDEGTEELREVVDYLQNPQRFAELGARAPKGVLLVGPPGTGKTLLAKAVAGEAQVPFIQLAGSEFVESLVGVGAARVRDLFKQARALAPCIVFIDELDAAGRQRGAGVGQGNDEREQTLNQLLVEMDGFSAGIGVAILGATNRPDILDPALLRPGRFDRQVVIDVPDVHGREQILKVHSRNRPLAPDCDLLSIAKQTPGFTGAELANIMNEAALLAVRRDHALVTQSDLEEAVDRVVAGPERRSHILSKEEKILIAYHEAGHAVVARGVGQDTGVLKLSIVARGLQLGHASTYSSADRMIQLRTEIEAELTTFVGGLAAEELVFGQTSTGNSKDLEKATTLARKLVATWGMSGVGRTQVLHEGAVFMGRDFAAAQHNSPETLNLVDQEIHRVLDEAEKRALHICKTNRALMDTIVAELLERETMTGPDLEPLLSKVRKIAMPNPYGFLGADATSDPEAEDVAVRRRNRVARAAAARKTGRR
jgi:cell division protease FtsH